MEQPHFAARFEGQSAYRVVRAIITTPSRGGQNELARVLPGTDKHYATGAIEALGSDDIFDFS